MDNKSEVFNFLSLLRGVAVSFVIWAHLGGWWLSSKGYSSFLQDGWEGIFVKPLHLFQNGGHLGVLIFFLVSGYIITHVSLRETALEFSIKRIFRIFPALAVALLITYIISYFCKRFGISYPLGLGDHDVSSYISSFFLINYLNGAVAVNGVTWTLLIEVIFYALTAVLMTMTRNNPTGATYFFIALVSFSIMLAGVVPGLKLLSFYSVYILFLLVGRSYYLGSSGVISTKESASLIVTCLFLYIAFYEYIYPGSLFTNPSPAYPVIYSDILAMIIFMFAANTCRSIGRAGIFVADSSYSLYLLHLPVGGLSLVFLDAAGFGFEVSFVVSLLICFVASYMMLVLVERPSQNAARLVIKKMQGG
ncbi:acyltransferase family protein [Pseudomonas marincola]|uniref:acyltransferase family protein n=1 Tax=Pseudomonas marincola TaxID=437900 RepID=UPI00123F3A72|nr:acyltransferase [Pseudomonas marincola]